jgi:hypothetical protein
MFAFVVAVLVIAFLLRAFAYRLTVPQHATAGAAPRPQAAAD